MGSHHSIHGATDNQLQPDDRSGVWCVRVSVSASDLSGRRPALPSLLYSTHVALAARTSSVQGSKQSLENEPLWYIKGFYSRK